MMTVLRIRPRQSVAVVALLALSPMVVAQQALEGEVGTVRFPVACNATAAAFVERGVAQLHHMMYVNARELFRRAETSDPSCAIALWGVAMTYIHPLWPDRPSPEELSIGEQLASRAISIGGHDAREGAYIATAQAYFGNAAGRSEAARLLRFEAAWKEAYEANPDDLEAQSFYALAQLATVDPSDKSYVKQLAAGALVEEVLGAVPDHPGAHHYIIHAYDLPGLAERALPVARHYGIVAPVVPHALHMMSHIFTRLGLWDESIEWNRRSADAALRQSQELGAISVHYQHAMDYLAYAYLQKGQDQEALAVVQTIASLQAPFDAVNRDAQAYAFAAVPARYALERKDWIAAAELKPRVPAAFPWEDSHIQYVALTHFARGLGLAHNNEFDAAEAEVTQLAQIRDEIETASPYWAVQVEIQRLGLQAWTAFLRGDIELGTALMVEAAEFESVTEKSPVTPGEALPASELLGEMLAQQGRYQEAVAAFEAALERSPLRLNSLYGAGQAFEKMGDAANARAFYAQITAIAGASSDRAAVEHARSY